MTKRNEYIAKMKLQLDGLDAKMTKLQADAKVMKAEARVKYEEQMTQLQAASKAAKSQLDSVVASSEDAWEKMVGEMEKLRDAFKHSFSYFKSQL